jgi:hypothetical protein
VQLLNIFQGVRQFLVVVFRFFAAGLVADKIRTSLGLCLDLVGFHFFFASGEIGRGERRKNRVAVREKFEIVVFFVVQLVLASTTLVFITFEK